MSIIVSIGIAIIIAAYIFFIGHLIIDSINEKKKEAEKRKERET